MKKFFTRLFVTIGVIATLAVGSLGAVTAYGVYTKKLDVALSKQSNGASDKVDIKFNVEVPKLASKTVETTATVTTDASTTETTSSK